MQKILVIQTAFIGDVVLSTAVLECLHQQYPDADLHVLVRKGNESLFEAHPFVQKVHIWEKKKEKYKNWWMLLLAIRRVEYDVVVNLQRYAATGLWTAFSKAKIKIGFDKNPISFLFTHAVVHFEQVAGMHEIDKNHTLLQVLEPMPLCKPKLYPTAQHHQQVATLQTNPYICIAPASVWFTKQFPLQSWIQFVHEIPFQGNIYIIGGPGDKALGDTIVSAVDLSAQPTKKLINVAGQFSFLASAALQQKAVLNYVNDSAPMHFCSAVNAPVVAIYCSTIPDFGYGPLSDQSFIVQTLQQLPCRPCGVHGKKDCPVGHFKCGTTIQLQQLFTPLTQVAQH
jgi:heptosyltransferase-2